MSSSDELTQIRGETKNFSDHKQRPSLPAVYNVESLKKARQLYMRDLIADQIELVDHKTNINSRKVKKAVVQEFIAQTGLNSYTASMYYDEAKQDAQSLIGVGQVYAQTLKLNMDILQHAHDNVEFSEKGSSEMAQAINAYTNVLKNVTDILGKLQLYDVNKERNEVQREKIKADTEVGFAQVSANLQGTLEEKRTLMTNSLKNSKALRTVINQLKKDDDTAEDDVGSNLIEEFRGVVLDDERSID